MNEFKYIQVWISDDDYYVLRTGGNKPSRALDKHNKDVPAEFDEVRKYEPIITNEV